MKKLSKLSIEPQTISPRAWYYEETGGIDVIIEHKDAEGKLIGGKPLHVKIP